MKTLVTVVGLALTTAGLSLAEQMIGSIQCATAAQYDGDHKKCAEAGQPLVFVGDADQKTYRLANKDKDKVKAFVGQKVIVDGTPSGDSIAIASVLPKRD